MLLPRVAYVVPAFEWHAGEGTFGDTSSTTKSSEPVQTSRSAMTAPQEQEESRQFVPISLLSHSGLVEAIESDAVTLFHAKVCVSISFVVCGL